MEFWCERIVTTYIIFIGLTLGLGCQSDARINAFIDSSNFLDYDDVPFITKINQDTVYLDNGEKVMVPGVNSGKDKVFVFLKNAEVDTIGMDPGLSDAGELRTRKLLKLFASSTIQSTHLTLYRRTFLTIQPLVDLKDLETERYEAGDLGYFYEEVILPASGLHLVVGHEEMITSLMNYMQEEYTFPQIPETVHDFMYFVTFKKNKIDKIYQYRY